ncbi:MAG: Hsp20/alpha crystallin family protein [Flavobacteriales bacterium]|nr:Hsp20/alpha crystallin family protein [Flavobacteriales bacterium]
MTLTKFSPRPVFVSPFNELVNEFFGRDIGQLLGQDELKRPTTHVNIVERNDHFDLQVLAPGFVKEDLKIHVENEVLTISAEKKQEQLDQNERFTRREFVLNGFSRSFRLPEKVNIDALEASFANGILKVVIPKAEPVKPKVREIGIA